MGRTGVRAVRTCVRSVLPDCAPARLPPILPPLGGLHTTPRSCQNGMKCEIVILHRNACTAKDEEGKPWQSGRDTARVACTSARATASGVRGSIWVHDGKRRRKVKHCKTRKQVAEKLKTTQYAQASGANLAAQRITARQFLERWLSEIINRGISPAPLMDIRRLCTSISFAAP
jgi:hypothetical protein